MKKIIILIIIPFIITACAFPNYVFVNKAQTTGLDFTKGKWLLNQVEAPYSLTTKLTELSISDFSKNLQERLVHVSKAKGILLPSTIPLNPDKESLKNLKTGTGYDYFINIKAEITKKEFGDIDTTPHKFNNSALHQVANKRGVITIEIYDLTLLDIVYSQKAIGTIQLPQDNNDIHVSNSVNSLIMGGYARIIKDINKKSQLNN